MGFLVPAHDFPFQWLTRGRQLSLVISCHSIYGCRRQAWLRSFGLTKTFQFSKYNDQYIKSEAVMQNFLENLI